MGIHAEVSISGLPFFVDTGHMRQVDLQLDVPESRLEAVCSHEQWGEVYERLTDLIESHRSTLVFVNTRRMTERVAHQLTERLGEEAVTSHHGSLSKELRQSAEQRLKEGRLKAVVATASLEMGIDIGYIDLVCQIGSPRSIATFLQRIGRSGHCLGAVPKGWLFPLTRDELIECLALIRAAHRGQLDRIEQPVAPLDILSQQIVASAAVEPWSEEALYDMVRCAWPFRDLTRKDFDEILTMLNEGLSPRLPRGKWLHRDRIESIVRGRRGAQLTALTCGGAIPETGEYRVITEDDRTVVGRVDEDFAIESLAGDVFLLGNTSWRIRKIHSGEVVVRDAQGAPPNIPFWFGEAPGRTNELSVALSELRKEIADSTESDWLVEQCGAPPWAAVQANEYVAAQVAAIGLVPTQERIVFERFFDESGGMQLVIHSPWGARINRAWGLALRKRFCRSFDFELQASADDNGIVLSLGPQHSFPIENLFKMLGTHNAQTLLEQALLAAPLFQIRWRWNVTRALVVQRNRSGKKVPPYLQRFQADDALAAVFPDSAGCLENHSEDIKYPDHPLVRQTLHDALHEAMDVDGWVAVLEDVAAGEIEFLARDTREPSPFSHQLINANPYAFLDPATEEEVEPWRAWLAPMQQAGRVVKWSIGELHLWSAAERIPLLQAVYPQATVEPLVDLPESLKEEWESATAVVELVRGRIQHVGPTAPTQIAQLLALPVGQIEASLEALEGDGIVMRGEYLREDKTEESIFPEELTRATSQKEKESLQWCDRRLLARIHRLTLAGLRERIRPVEPSEYVRFLLRHHRILADEQWGGAVAVRDVVQQLQGMELSAAAWETHLLPLRIGQYESQWLDDLFQTGELVWGRLRPPRRTFEGRSSLLLHRAVPITIALREDLPALLPADRETVGDSLRSSAAEVLESLSREGALFFQQLAASSELLPAQLEEALRELAGSGWVTCDGFAAVRSLIARKQPTHRRRRSSGHRQVPTGRWTRFPGPLPEVDRAKQLEQWRHQLLRRWGVVFRDLLAREPAAPPWHELVPGFRAMERRGEVRGGRFIIGVGGEQFGTESAVIELRKIREEVSPDPWIVVSAADPLNLSGIIDDGPRLPAMHTHSLAIEQGRVIATLIAGNVEILVQRDKATLWEITRALRRGHRELVTGDRVTTN